MRYHSLISILRASASHRSKGRRLHPLQELPRLLHYSHNRRRADARDSVPPPGGHSFCSCPGAGRAAPKEKRASVAPAGGHDAGANEGEAGATAGGLPLAGAGGGVELEGYEEGEEDMEGVDIGDEGEYEEFEADIET